MPPTLLIRLLLLLAIVGAPSGARADAGALPRDVLEASKRHYETGAAFYQEGKYVEAHVEFLAAYRLSKIPDLLYNLGRVSEKMGQPGEAAEYFDRYLKERADAPDREAVEADVARLRKAAEPAPVAPPAPAPAPAPVAVVHRAQAPPSRPLPPWPALGMMGGGAALLIVGVALGGAAQAAAGQVEAGERFDAALDARGRSLQGAAIFFDVVGALALGGGAAWTIAWWVRRGREPAPRAALRLVPAGAGLALSGSF
jgi:tetratricopeptide (TPR) repeat protein